MCRWRCSEFSATFRMIPLKSLEKLGQASSRRQTWTCQPSTRICQKYSNPNYKMITQGMLKVRLLRNTSGRWLISELLSICAITMYCSIQNKTYISTHTPPPNKNRQNLPLLMLLSPLSPSSSNAVELITSCAKFGRCRVQNSYLVQDTDDSDCDFSCSLSELPEKCRDR